VIVTDKTIKRVPPIGVTKLSELIIDTTKDWEGYRITNLGTPSLSTDALRLAELITHKTANPIDHPDASIPIRKLAFRTFREIYRRSWINTTINIAITGLSIINDKLYILMVNQASVGSYYLLGRLFINNDQTTTRYYSQYLVVDGTTISAGRDNDAWVLDEPVYNITGSAIIYIFRSHRGYARAISIASVNISNSVKTKIRNLIYINTVTDITQINYDTVYLSSGELVLYSGVT
jgi:hypothetical protein